MIKWHISILEGEISKIHDIFTPDGIFVGNEILKGNYQRYNT